MPYNFFFAEQTFFAQICVLRQSNLSISLFENILKFYGAAASFASVSTICRLACVTIPTVWYLMFLSFYDLSTSLCNCSDSVVSNVFDFINEN
jgi:hypothetical protein